jgi:hypothetical protein
MEKKREKVLEFAHRRLIEELKESELGADNDYSIRYWAAYIEGATAQLKECTERLKAVNDEFSV